MLRLLPKACSHRTKYSHTQTLALGVGGGGGGDEGERGDPMLFADVKIHELTLTVGREKQNKNDDKNRRG